MQATINNRPLMFLFAVVSMTLASFFAHAAPISSCSYNDSIDTTKGFTCNLYESDSIGNSSEISSVSLPFSVSTGFVVLVEDPSGSQTDATNWSDVLKFPDAGEGLATNAILYSIGCNVGPGDTSCFPALASADHTFINEDSSGVSTWISGPNTYLIHSDAVSEVPEPGSLTLLAFGLTAIVLSRRS